MSLEFRSSTLCGGVQSRNADVAPSPSRSANQRSAEACPARLWVMFHAVPLAAELRAANAKEIGNSLRWKAFHLHKSGLLLLLTVHSHMFSLSISELLALLDGKVPH